MTMVNRPTVVRALAVALLALLGALCGVYLGRSFGLGRPAASPPIRPSGTSLQLDSNYRMICRPGDKLPDAAVINSDGDSVLLSSIFDGAPTVLFFWHLDCPACMEQAVLWNIFMEPHLRDDVKQVACLDMGSEDVAAQYSEQLQHKLIVYVDYEQLRSVYNLVLYPIIVTIDGRGKITHIQYEYSSLFDEEIVRLVTNVVVGG